MLLTGLHFGLRYLVFRQIAGRLGDGIRWSQLSLGYFPLSIGLEEVTDLDIPGITRLSCRRVQVSMPFWALLTDKKPLDIVAVDPRLAVDEQLLDSLEKRSKPSGDSVFYLRRLEVEKGLVAWTDQASGLSISIEDFQVESISKQGVGALRVTVPHVKLNLPLSGETIPLVGQLELEMKHMPDTLSIRRLEWHSEELNLIGNGRYFLSDRSFVLRSSIQLQTKPFLHPVIKGMAPEASAYGDLMIKKTPDGLINARSTLRAARFSLKGHSYERLNASVNWDNRSKEIQALTLFDDDNLHGGVDVFSRPGGVEVFIRNLSARKIADIISVGGIAPLNSRVVSAQFSVKKGQIGGNAALEADVNDRRGFNLAGPVEFLYDTRTGATRFNCRDGHSEMGPFTISGEVDPQMPQSMKIDVSLNVYSLEMADFYSRHFIDLDLGRWKLEHGLGRLDVHLLERNGQMQSRSEFILEELSSSGIQLRNLSGSVTSQGKQAEGHMELRDEKLNGEAFMRHTREETVVDFKNARGSLETILGLLDLGLDLKGGGQGDFTYRQSTRRGALPQISGTFSTGPVLLTGFPFSEVTGRLWSDSEKIRLSELGYRFYKGKGTTELFIDYPARQYEMSGSVEGLDSQAMHGEFKGLGTCTFKGSGEFMADPIRLDLTFPEMTFYADRPFALEAHADVLSDFENFSLKAEGKVKRPGIDMPLSLVLASQQDRYQGTFTGSIGDLNLLIPWKDNQGELNLDIRIGTGAQGELDFQGLGNFKGKRLTFPGFAHTIDDFDGFFTIRNGDITLQSFRGQMGGGQIESSGTLSVDGESIRSLNLGIRGKGMTLYPMDRVKCFLDTDLTLSYTGERFLLAGPLTFGDTLWEREMMEGLSFNTDADFSAAESAFLDRLSYDLSLQSRGNIRLRNSMMDGTGTFDLHLGGGFDRPLITGVLEARSGTFFFGDKKFAVSKAKVLFNNPFVMNPIISLDSETFIQNYRIRFTVSGPLSKLSPQIISSPPLPQQDILALITQGEMFKRPVSSELSSRMGTAGLVSDFVLEDVKKRAKSLFGIDILRLEPDTERELSAGESRVTIGTSIARNIVIVYSNGMSMSRRYVLYVHYQLTPDIALIAMRNEDEFYSLDVRYRKRVQK